MRSMPKPHQEATIPKKSSSGSGSGSLRTALAQMNRSQEAKYRNSIAHVCEKINTLRSTGQAGATMIEYDTFVCKAGGGDSDGEGELEAPGTILDNSMLRHITQQLDTFVIKETLQAEKNGGSDDETTGTIVGHGESDDETTGTIVGHGGPGVNGKHDSDEEGQTLLRQYSQTLNESWDDDVGESEQPSVKEQNNDNDKVQAHSSNNNEPESGDFDTFAEETLINVSKYKYKGLKDTLARRPDRRWKHRPPSDPSDWFSPQKAADEESGDSAPSSPSKARSHSKHDILPRSVEKVKSVSLSSTGSFNGSRTRTGDTRLLQTIDGTTKSRANKVPVCDRIEQSSMKKLTKGDVVKKVKKEAFMEPSVPVDGGEGEPEFSVDAVMAHLKDNISPYTSVDSHSETIKAKSGQEDDVFDSQVVGGGVTGLFVTYCVLIWLGLQVFMYDDLLCNVCCV